MNTLLANSLPDYLIPTLIDSPELAAGFVLWMTTQSTESDFLRGRYISCNWDVDQLLAKKEEIIKKNLLWTRVIGQETELM